MGTIEDNGVIAFKGIPYAKAPAAQATAKNGPSLADKLLHAVRHTLITKHVLRLFIKNMTAK